MQRYIAKRLFQMVLALFLLSVVIFGLARIAGDPALLMLPEGSTQEDYARIRADLGLDQPIYIQYGIFVSNALQGDLGNSIHTRRPVMASIMLALPNSMKLVAVAFVMAFLIGIPLAVMGAVKKGTPFDTFSRVVAGLGQSLPTFWVGLILIQIFGIHLRLLPVSGMATWQHYLMPAFCLAFFFMAAVIRLVRSAMLESLESEYIRLARIKGVPERTVIWKHAFRNSLVPLLGFSGMHIVLMITGAILVETVFTWPGFGRLAYRAIIGRDYPLIQGTVLVAGVLAMGLNLAADLLYAKVDPRIRY